MPAQRKTPPDGAAQAECWLDRGANRRRTHFGRRPNPVERRREAALKDWYGPDEARLQITARQRPARPITGVVDQVLARVNTPEIALLNRLRSGWPELVGADIARHTAPVGVWRATLDVEVTDATWLFVLQREHAAALNERVAEATTGAIRRVRLVPAGRHAAHGREGTKPRRGRPSRSGNKTTR